MNTGAEAVETAIKAPGAGATRGKGTQNALRSSCAMATSTGARRPSSGSPATRDSSGSGLFAPGFVSVPFGDLEALAAAIADDSCRPRRAHSVRVRNHHSPRRDATRWPTGSATTRRPFHRRRDPDGPRTTGATFACDHEGVDLISGAWQGPGRRDHAAVRGRRRVGRPQGLHTVGSHGSTFGGNPLACAVGREVLDMLSTGEHQDRSARLGAHLHAASARAAQARRHRGPRPGALGRPRPRRPHACPASSRRGNAPPTSSHQRRARAHVAAGATARCLRFRPRLGPRPDRRGHRDGVVGSMNKEKGTR